MPLVRIMRTITNLCGGRKPEAMHIGLRRGHETGAQEWRPRACAGDDLRPPGGAGVRRSVLSIHRHALEEHAFHRDEAHELNGRGRRYERPSVTRNRWLIASAAR